MGADDAPGMREGWRRRLLFPPRMQPADRARPPRRAQRLHLDGKLWLAAKPQRAKILTRYLLQSPPRAGSLG